MQSPSRLHHVRRRIRSRERWAARHVRRWKHHTNDARLWRDQASPKSRHARAFARRLKRLVKANQGRWEGVTDAAAYVLGLRSDNEKLSGALKKEDPNV